MSLEKLGKFRVVLLSPEHYAHRRKRFYASLKENGGSLHDRIIWFKATPWRETCPPAGAWFKQVRKHCHYWAATGDHITILEKAILDGVEALLVLEDDASTIPFCEVKLGRVIEQLPEDWMAVQLNWNARWDGGSRPEGLHPPKGGGTGQMANLWSRKGMIRFHSHACANRHKTIDSAYEDLRAKEPDGFFSSATQLFTQDSLSCGRGLDS